MHTTTANVRCNPPMLQKNVDHDLTLAASNSSVICWQEIWLVRYVQAIVRLLPTKTWGHHIVDRTGDPISWRRSMWGAATTGIMIGHGGKRGATPTRYSSWALLVRRGQGRGFPIVFINSHFVSGGWSKLPKPFKAWRRLVWGIHFARLQKLVSYFVDELGLTVVVQGDFNKSTLPTLHSKAQEVVSGGGIDHQIVVEGRNVAVEIYHGEQLAGFKTDHHPRRADLRFSWKHGADRSVPRVRIPAELATKPVTPSTSAVE